MILQFVKISGKSLEPAYRDGDFVLVSKIPYLLRPPQAGEAVVFRHAQHGLLIKRIERVLPTGELWVAGLRPSSVDSYEFGPVRARDVLGRVVWRVRKPS